jgi:hypothetical protein
LRQADSIAANVSFSSLSPTNFFQESGPVDRFFDLSVGSDYPGTLIRDDSQAQLKLVADELGFRYLRFHAIFHDVLGTVRVEDGNTVYNWSKIDQLYDNMLARHIKPFVELGFTPKALATSQNSIFYWQGNTSHPKPEGWRNLIDAFVRHIEERYGKDEVRSWFFEVWNEPNLSGFWEGGDQKAYFELYDLTAKTIKSIDPALRVGGPSTAGAAWVPEFLAHVKQSGAGVDFVTTHTYGVDSGFLDEKGSARYQALPIARRNCRRRAASSRADFGFTVPALPLYFTEWSTSYTPRDSVHDSYISAPYILTKLKASQGLVAGHELLDLHRPLRGTRTSIGSISRRIRPPEPARHSQAGILCVQIPARPAGRQPQDERSASYAIRQKTVTSPLSYGISNIQTRRSAIDPSIPKLVPASRCRACQVTSHASCSKYCLSAW